MQLSDLKSDKRNARKRTPRSASMLTESLQQVGAARSIVIDEDNNILAGNGTVEAAGQVGIERVRVIEADGNEIIAVRRSNLSDEQKLKLSLYDNRTAELAEWDLQVLGELGDDVDLSQFFNPDELQGLLDEVETASKYEMPEENKDIDEEALAETNCECPKCGFAWKK
jgi:ParB-like chromosome segregation protein Spo0J